ncbi:multi-sensor signal transduction histidine kinase [Methanoregula boonei 6A8]|jgi:PAS domain S-box-containing protein|uniref:histidine kinase n=1 Tax=Methanoregula boonei (strain DSM 21154 / JCM 14090 / 6A8) TaxID=456442 RepID=A7I5H4_METB6|nr:HAMP domain-containing sensor histidine kinase [Methanoregula boonei]ABS54985.1 multi-sensor signal transduction histidine kinase [Methanoregula boonei 6A8]
MGTKADPTPFDQRLFLIFIVTFASMTAFEFIGQYLYPYEPDWRSNLIISLFASGLAVMLAYFLLSPYYENVSILAEEIKNRHRVERDLREREERLRRTFDQSPVGAALCSPDLRFIRVNNALCTISGYTPEELLTLSIPAITVQKESADLAGCAEALMCGRADLDERDLHLVKKNGDRIWVRLSVSLVRDVEGAPLYFIPMFVDIHDRKLAEDALQKTNRKLSILSSVTRHDIKNQLTGLGVYLQMVRNEVPDNPILQGYISKLVACSEAIDRQIEFTRYYEELGTANAGWFDVYQGILDQAIQLPLEGVMLDPGKKGIYIFTDPLIGKVYYNLIENSIRHGVNVKTIIFDAHETNNGLVIRYTDDGIGIPDAEKEKIFLKGYGKNTGLGLFLIREILATTGISIAETGMTGKGAQFEILVPRGEYRLSPK